MFMFSGSRVSGFSPQFGSDGSVSGFGFCNRWASGRCFWFIDPKYQNDIDRCLCSLVRSSEWWFYYGKWTESAIFLPEKDVWYMYGKPKLGLIGIDKFDSALPKTKYSIQLRNQAKELWYSGCDVF